MAKNLDNLLNLFFALVHIGAHVLDYGLRLRAEVPQHFNQQAVRVRKHIKDVGRFDYLSSPRPRAFHCSLEKIGGVGCNPKSFPDVLARVIQSLVYRPRYHFRIDSEAADGRVEEVRLFFRQSADNVLDRDVVLIAPTGFAQSVLQHALSAVAKFVPVGSQINHGFLHRLDSFSTAVQFKMPDVFGRAHPFDVQSIFIVAFQCNKNLSGYYQANPLPAVGDCGKAPRYGAKFKPPRPQLRQQIPSHRRELRRSRSVRGEFPRAKVSSPADFELKSESPALTAGRQSSGHSPRAPALPWRNLPIPARCYARAACGADARAERR